MSKLPVDPDAERNLLGSAWSGLTLLDPEARAALWDVPPEAFFIAEHRRIWSGMRALVQANKAPSEMVLAWECYGGKPTPEQQSGLIEILAHGSDLSTLPLKARVLEFHTRRTAMHAASEVILAAEDTSAPVDELLARANTAFLDIARGTGADNNPFFWASDLVQTISAGKGFRAGSATQKLCYFGIPWLDDLLLCTEGNVTILGGRPGAGKTGLAVQARNMTAVHGIVAGLFSLEMSQPEVNARDAAWWLSDPKRGRIFPYKAMIQGNYDAAAALESLRSSGIVGMDKALSWCHPSGIPVGKLAAYMTEAVRVHKMRLGIVDYFQYIGLNRQKGDSLASAFGANSMALKRLAQELGIHILVLSQLNRENDGKRPGLSDLKETSQLEQDASGVPMLYRDKDQNLCITVPKNRDGETVIERQLDVSWPCLRFHAMARETEAKLF